MREIANNQTLPQFNSTDAKALYKKMRTLYGAKFDRQWEKVNPYDVEEEFVSVLAGLSPAAIENGKRRMEREAWPPTLPEFRMWCEQGGAWLTADEAWANALMYQADSTTPITEQAHAALSRVLLIINNEGQKAASRAFKDIYQRLVGNCQARGKTQTQYQPQALAKPKQQDDKTVPIPADILEKIKTDLETTFVRVK